MLYTKRVVERKTGKKWIVESVSESFENVSIMLIDDLTGKYVFKANDIKSIRYNYGKITVNYSNNLRVIYS